MIANTEIGATHGWSGMHSVAETNENVPLIHFFRGGKLAQSPEITQEKGKQFMTDKEISLLSALSAFCP